MKSNDFFFFWYILFLDLPCKNTFFFFCNDHILLYLKAVLSPTSPRRWPAAGRPRHPVYLPLQAVPVWWSQLWHTRVAGDSLSPCFPLVSTWKCQSCLQLKALGRVQVREAFGWRTVPPVWAVVFFPWGKRLWSVWKCPLRFPLNHAEIDNAKHAFCSGIWPGIDSQGPLVRPHAATSILKMCLWVCRSALF